jgi:hypothetical protein
MQLKRRRSNKRVESSYERVGRAGVSVVGSGLARKSLYSPKIAVSHTKKTCRMACAVLNLLVLLLAVQAFAGTVFLFLWFFPFVYGV